MTLVHWQPMLHRAPFEGVSMLQRRMNRLFDDIFSGEGEDREMTWSPRVDLVEFEDRFEMTAELPGMKIEDVKLELENNILHIYGEKRAESERKDRNLYICERSYGGFRRSFQFPNQVDASKIDAGIKDGVLIVTLPKIEEAKPKQIEIKAH